MVRSMTGFGRATVEGQNCGFNVEIKSVNHRYLDLNIKMPRNLTALEERIRRLVKERINRGKIDIFITKNNYEDNNVVAKLNENLAESYLKCLYNIKNKYEVRDDISVSLIARFPDVVTVQVEEVDLEAIWLPLCDALTKGIDSLIDMRKREGEKLKEDIEKRCDIIKKYVDKVESKSPLVVEEYRTKLNERLNELLNDFQMDESRIAMEVAMFADKSNITEEIVRLNSHIIQLKDTLDSQDSIGRKLDFIVQEMNREANTIASKANNLELTKYILDVKTEIEKIREQIQNIE